MGFHKLVNTLYFSEAAQDFAKNKKLGYTMAPRGGREYREYWEMQEDRCMNGYSVGDLWIPGRHYFYLNFTPVLKVPDADMAKILMLPWQDRLKAEGVISKRVLEFPRFWEIDYEWYNYKFIAWFGGEFMGITSPGAQHMSCAKTRGAGFSYKEASDGVYNYTFIPRSKAYYFAGLEQYLTKDGILNKVEVMLTHINKFCPEWFQNRMKSSTLMHQQASYVDTRNETHGNMSEIIGVVVNDPDKAHPHSANIITPDGPRKWGDLKKGDFVFGSDGSQVTVLDTFEQGVKDIYTVTFDDGREVQCTYDHLWTVSRWRTKHESEGGRELRTETVTTEQIVQRMSLPSHETNRIKIQLNGCTDYPETPVPMDAYTLGLMLGDGSFGKSSNNLSYLTMMHEDLESVAHRVPHKIERESWGTGIRNKVHIAKGKTMYQAMGLFDKRSGTKFIPTIYKYNSKAVRLSIVNGLLDTDGSVTKDFGVIEYSTKSSMLAQDFIWIIHSLGFGGAVKRRMINGTTYYRCFVYCKPQEQGLFNLLRKKRLIAVKRDTGRGLNKSSYVQVQSVKYSHREHAMCIRVDAPDHLYLIEDHIVTHNTRGKRGEKITFEEAGSFRNLKKALDTSIASIKDGGITVGQISLFGTGGEEGPDIEGLEEIFEDPKTYNMLAFPNIWEDGMETTLCGYFVPCWRANNLFIDKEGSPEIEGAVQFELNTRASMKGAKDYRKLDRQQAEFPTRPSEVFKRLSTNPFRGNAIKAHIQHVEKSSAIQGLIRYGYFKDTEKEGLKFVIQTKDKARPVLNYPHTKLDFLEGCITIFEAPFVLNNEVPKGLYQVVFDPYYKEDSEDLTSLFAVYVLKQYNNIDAKSEGLPVANYIGRPDDLDTAYKALFDLAKFYNSSVQGEIAGGGQGVLDYATREKLLHLVEFEPEMLHNKELASNAKNRSYLMNMATEKKRMGLTYLIDWHKQPRGINERGHKILNLHRIYDVGLLYEMLKFGKNNADRISAMIIGMFMLKENAAKIIERRTIENTFFNREFFGEGGLSYADEPTLITSY